MLVDDDAPQDQKNLPQYISLYDGNYLHLCFSEPGGYSDFILLILP